MNRKNEYPILIIAIIFVIECIYFKLLGDDTNSLLLLPVFFTNLFLLYVLYARKNDDEIDKRIKTLIFISFLLRTCLLIAIIFGFENPFGGEGSDAMLFYNTAIGSNNLQFNYSDFLKIIIMIIGKNYHALIYVNVLFSLLSQIVFYKMLKLIGILTYKQMIIVMSIFIFAPMNMSLSTSLLREEVMICLNVISLYYFILWYKTGKVISIVISSFSVVLSAYFHSGMIFALVANLLIFLLYSPRTRTFSFHTKTLINLVIILLFVFVIDKVFGNSITHYFQNMMSVEKATAKTKISSTDYLTFLNNSNNLFITVVSFPLRMIYFYLSPMIWDCRSLSIFVSFLLSGVIYIYLFFAIVHNKTNDRTLTIMIILIILLLSIPHSYGVKTAGAALRHREKILPYILTAFALTKRKDKEIEKYD